MVASKRKQSATRTTKPTASARVHRELDIHRQELTAQNEELRRANGELTTAKERYAQLYDGAPIGYFTLDEDAIIVEANLAGAGLIGAPRHVLFGRCFDELVAPASRASFRSFRRRLLEAGEPLVHETTLAIGARRVPVRIEAARIATDHDAAPQCLLCVTDESARRQIEAERRAFQVRAAEVTRVDSLGALAGSVAHDLNNIISVVLAHADLLLLGEAGSATAAVSVKHIRDAALRAAELAREMSSYCGEERLRAEPLDVSTLIGAMRDMLVRSGSHDIELVLDLAEGLPLVIGDGARLQQVVLNLVVNAIESIGPGAGRIIVRTTEGSSSAVARPQCYVGGVVIECRDNGRGMDPRTAHQAFDPFFTTKLKGRGLGLALVHGTVRAHGGVVTVESQSGTGTTFRVFLPAALAGSPGNAN